MTDHNKVVGILHIAYSAFSLLIVVVMVLFVFGIIGMAAAEQGAAAGGVVIAVVMMFVLGLNIAFSIPSFLAGYAMIKRKAWARTAAIVAAIVDGLSFPFGTALCVYTLWFMFSAEGKQLYDRNSNLLPPAPPRWTDLRADREPEYVPPTVPPDWR